MEKQGNKIKASDQSISEGVVCSGGAASENKINSSAIRPTTKEAGHKLRRAFSMPRNPFRLSTRKHNHGNLDDKTVMTDAGRADTVEPISAATARNNATFDTVASNDDVTATTTITNDSGGGGGGGSSSSSSCIVSEQSAAIVVTHITSDSGGVQQQQEPIAAASISSSNKHRIFRRSSWKKMISRFAQQMTSINIGAKQSTISSNRVPPLGGYKWPPDQIPGVTGLKNHGNTCFMNAVLQCLSHTDILAEYFVLDQYKADLKRRNKLTSRKFGTKGELTEQLALVLKALWTCKIESDYSTSFKAVVDRYGSQFRSSTQHDAQEFLFWLLDKVHEDLNTASKRKYKSIKNSYGRPDEVIAAETLANHIRCNSSFVQAVFQAQFRSSLACPQCHKQSNTFDPFHCISVQLPQLSQQSVFVTVLYATQHPRQVKLGIGVPTGTPVVALREQLQADTGIPAERIMLGEIGAHGFGRVFCDSHPMSSITASDPIYCIETMPVVDSTNLTLIILNVRRMDVNAAAPTSAEAQRFGTPLCVQVGRDVSYRELQKKLLKEMQTVLKSEVFAYATQPADMFRIRLHDPSADPDTYIDPNVEHPLFTEMIDLALSVLPSDVGPAHVKLVLEWSEPEAFFNDISDAFVEHESVTQFKEKCKGTPHLTLAQCLEHYTKAETLSTEDAWRCPHCQKYLPVVKTLGLWSLPDILVIHFKRFRQQHSKGPLSAKLTTAVHFPLTGFDMSPHLAKSVDNPTAASAEDNWSPWRKLKRRENCIQAKDTRYDLYAVCYHQGDTLETGHYTAACKNPYDHQWYKFDDQKVSQVPADNIPDDIVNNEAYILFYQRRKPDAMESSGSSSASGDHWVSKITVAPDLVVATAAITTTTTAAADSLNMAEKQSVSQTTAVKVIDENHIPSSPNVANVIASTDVVHVDVEMLKDPEPSPSKDGAAVCGELLKIQKTNEDEFVDVEILDEPEIAPAAPPTNSNDTSAAEMIAFEQRPLKSTVASAEPEESNDFVELRRHNAGGVVEMHENISSSVPLERSIWPIDGYHPIVNNRGSLNISDVLSKNLRNDHRRSDYNIRHSVSAALRQQKDANDTIAMIRGVNACSKDTVMFMDQPVHSFMNDDNSFLGNRSLWISPVAPHKMITISPKN